VYILTNQLVKEDEVNKLLILLLASSTLTLSAHASVIREVERNNNFNQAQNLEDFFSNDYKRRVENSGVSDWEWVSIKGRGNGTYDYYVFEAFAGQDYIFDIDKGMSKRHSVDTELGLWALEGMLLHEQDDCYSDNGGALDCSRTWLSSDKGSNHIFDPMFSWTFETSGLFVVGVGKFYTYADEDGFGFDQDGQATQRGERYKLNVSRSLPFATQSIDIPEPASLAIFALGLIGIGAARSKRRRRR
jgi:hypothetical protein